MSTPCTAVPSCARPPPSAVARPGCAAAAFAAAQGQARRRRALIVVDVQNCFVDGGTLPVKGGAEVVPVINKLAGGLREHRRHAGLAHAGPRLVRQQRTPARSRSRPPSSTTATRCCGPTTACRARDDAALHKDLKLPTAQLIIRKGFNKGVDSYSAFEEADRKTVDRPGRLPEGARHQDRVRHRPGHRLLRRPGPRWTRARPASRST